MGNAAFSSRFPSVMELRELDKNGDGTVSVQELGAYFNDVPEEEVDATFLTLLADREAITSKAVDSIFNLLDRDGMRLSDFTNPSCNSNVFSCSVVLAFFHCRFAHPIIQAAKRSSTPNSPRGRAKAVCSRPADAVSAATSGTTRTR